MRIELYPAHNINQPADHKIYDVCIKMSHNSNLIQFLPILQLTLPEGAQTRLRHTVMALSLRPGWTKVIMFGGCPKWQWGKSEHDQQNLAKTAILEFGEQTHIHNISFPLINYLALLGCEH